MLQTFQLGDRVRYEISEPAVASIPKKNRTQTGRVVKISLRFPSSPDLTTVVYHILFDRSLLSSREWSLSCRPGECPPGLAHGP